MTIQAAHTILFVADQALSTEFYSTVLGARPRLNVPGMTEFDVAGGVLGLMPRTGAARLLGLPAPSRASLQAELYLVVDDPAQYHARALSAGGTELSPLLPRDWGDHAAYSRDLDGYVLAFASRSE